ncbi:PBSX family phage terminase large subunit [Leuconostoc pseudomesenteroides]|uniref:PBSX family phage terminase large subunit n=1 Tax=Leuconostoc pseudomesenteroides TaxID=33968 RepID=UPI00403D9E97
MTVPTIDIQKEVQPHFKNVWLTQKPYNILYGGRNSFKSSVVALKLVDMMMREIRFNHKANIVVIRKVGNTIRDSVYQKIQWALKKYGLIGQFNTTVSPFKITHRTTGSTFYFYGSDDFQKLKSNDINNIIAVWYEESAEFRSAEEFDQSNITFMRQKQMHVPHVKFFWSYNPPRNPYEWINEWVKDKRTDDNYLVDYSSYLDDELGWLKAKGGQILDEINRIKENDYDYYRYIYLGEAVGLGTNVWNMSLFHKVESIDPDIITRLFFSADVGHQVSATAVGAYGTDGDNNVYLLDTYYYSPAGKSIKRAPSQFVDDIYNFIQVVKKRYKQAKIQQLTIDSAEGGLRNEFWLKHHMRWNPVAKKTKVVMVDYVHTLLAEGRFYYLNNDSNQIFVQQQQMYRWDEKTLRSDKPEVVKEDDHTSDELQYMVVDNARLLGLKR